MDTNLSVKPAGASAHSSLLSVCQVGCRCEKIAAPLHNPLHCQARSIAAEKRILDLKVMIRRTQVSQFVPHFILHYNAKFAEFTSRPQPG